MVEHLGPEFRFCIVTSDRDLGEKTRYPGIVTNVWTRVPGANVLYVSPGLRGLFTIWQILRKMDHSLLYINGIFPRRFSIFPFLFCKMRLVRKVPLLIAPRGEFSPGALRIKAKRKRFFLFLIRLSQFENDVVWQASSELERDDIVRQLSNPTQIELARNLPTTLKRSVHDMIVVAQDLHSKRENNMTEGSIDKRRGTLRIVFISRVSRMKNLDGAIRMLKGLTGNIEFDIYGPIEDRTLWQECLTLVETLGDNIRVKYCGVLPQNEVVGVFSKYHLFLFPTHGENYGHVIAESLTAGCPVLLSDRTSWQGLDREGVGWNIPLDQPENFRAAITRCVKMEADEFRSFSVRTKAYGLNRILDPGPVIRHREMLLRALGQPRVSS